ncbi:extracellular solute-binding protein [Paeniroseomonas aquatica]|uniref:extracellular solute-binding protein n=1 Tax=Paeniroseomonas aquatica TaxID=373043 RepID=UPI003606646E
MVGHRMEGSPAGAECALIGPGEVHADGSTPQEGQCPCRVSSRTASHWRSASTAVVIPAVVPCSGASPRSAPSPRGARRRRRPSANWSWSTGAAWPTRASAILRRPFLAETPGWKVAQDSTGPATGRIRSMVESGRTTWDLCDSSASGANLLGKLGLATKIDYSIVDRGNVIGPGFALEYGAAPYSFSSVLVYDSAIPDRPDLLGGFLGHPQIPGTRLLRRDATCTLEAALMSMGRDPAALYPVDTRAALKRVLELRRNLVMWTNGSESEQLMRTGEAVMGQIWHTRATVLEKESNGRFKFLWNQAILQPGIFVIPKGNPGGEMAQRLLASMLAKPEPQVGLLGLLGNGPTNPAPPRWCRPSCAASTRPTRRTRSSRSSSTAPGGARTTRR